MSEWQDIETAPKDGTIVDLWFRGSRTENCYYEIVSHNNKILFKGWRTESYPKQSFREEIVTHWMPLPEPPTNG